MTKIGFSFIVIFLSTQLLFYSHLYTNFNSLQPFWCIVCSFNFVQLNCKSLGRLIKGESVLKVGVNHGIFHVYHFWNFLIFKCTWVCSSSSSKNKNIFLNLSINSINLKMSIYLSISKICSSLFRGEIKLARV